MTDGATAWLYSFWVSRYDDSAGKFYNEFQDYGPEDAVRFAQQFADTEDHVLISAIRVPRDEYVAKCIDENGGEPLLDEGRA